MQEGKGVQVVKEVVVPWVHEVQVEVEEVGVKLRLAYWGAIQCNGVGWWGAQHGGAVWCAGTRDTQGAPPPTIGCSVQCGGAGERGKKP